MHQIWPDVRELNRQVDLLRSRHCSNYIVVTRQGLAAFHTSLLAVPIPEFILLVDKSELPCDDSIANIAAALFRQEAAAYDNFHATLEDTGHNIYLLFLSEDRWQELHGQYYITIGLVSVSINSRIFYAPNSNGFATPLWLAQPAAKSEE